MTKPGLPSVQENVTEANDTRRWKSTSTLEHSFSLSDKGKELTCRVYHLAYVSQGYQESSVSLDLMCKHLFFLFEYFDFLEFFIFF